MLKISYDRSNNTITIHDLVDYLELCRDFCRNTNFPFVAHMADGTEKHHLADIIEEVKFREYKVNKISWLGSAETGECLFSFPLSAA